MKKTDAAAILGLSGELSPETTRAAWLAIVKRLHPDTNPDASPDLIKMVNAAYDVLRDESGTVEPGAAAGYGETLEAALNALRGLAGLEIEICGSWVWVRGNTREHKEALKAAGYRWSNAKEAWYFSPDGKRRFSRGSWDMAQIRNVYGSTRPVWRDRVAIEGGA